MYSVSKHLFHPLLSLSVELRVNKLNLISKVMKFMHAAPGS